MQQERFGDAFLIALASVAGCTCAKPDTDNDSIDWTISCKLPRRPKIDVQMKTHRMEGEIQDEISYPLNRKNYDDLTITDVLVPRILVLVILPSNLTDWLTATAQQLVLRKSAYWLSLMGFPESDNQTKTTVKIPMAQMLTVETLQEMMLRIDEEGGL
jgi:hypothetical protein